MSDSPDDTKTDSEVRLPEARGSTPPRAPSSSGTLRAALPPLRSALPPLASSARTGSSASPSIAPTALPSSAIARTGTSPSARPPQSLVRPTAPPPPKRSSSLPPALARASTPPPGSSPDFLIPRPPSAPSIATAARASTAPDVSLDPWRERIAQLEIQLSAARAAASRAQQDAIASRERADALSARLDRIESELGAELERAVSTARDAMARAERPLPLEALDARTSEVETLAHTARAGVSAFRSELAENRRLDEARAVRLASIEDRVARIEGDPRPDELRLAIDRIETRMLGIEREQAAMRTRVDALLDEVRSERARMSSAIESAEKAFARIEELAEAQDELRTASSVDALLPRMADLESLVIENGRNDARLEKELESLRARLDAAPVPAASPDAASLRTIAGIGPKIEAKLHALGIAHRAALAALDDDAIKRVASELAIKREKLAAWRDAARA
ncbi:hypothetical protein [Sandaracinus amylolyticus]|uniref:Plectin 1 isoform 8 n=1 Tax=Sandaracinus amylolyticus TaxID=927083 RepID=A0A0F6YJG0_9BACT|nr:hypothetical protein [Sandaracinus amylolyticus]AKF08032.1 plectin 1 isoform 8 [Sandaracinus amylolyticus]